MAQTPTAPMHPPRLARRRGVERDRTAAGAEGVSRCKVSVRRSLAVGHFVLGSACLLGVVSYGFVGIRSLPHLLIAAPRTPLPGALLRVVAVVLLPELVLGAWLLVLARWSWSGHRGLRTALLATHGFLILLAALTIKWGLQATAAAARSTAHGGGLLSPVAFFPFLVGVPLLLFAVCSIAAALWAVPPTQPSAVSEPPQ